MFLIDCPWCGCRPQSEFAARGEAHIVRPADPATASDADWAAYLFLRGNPKGLLLERWLHAHGCRRWFNIARNTASDEILAVYRPGEKPPALPGSAPPAPPPSTPSPPTPSAPTPSAEVPPLGQPGAAPEDDR